MNSFNETAVQREMPWLMELKEAKFASREIIEGFRSQREAVIWAWSHRTYHGLNEKGDQSLFATHTGIHPPHFSRAVNPNSKAPMNLHPDFINQFEAYTGWRVVSQYDAKSRNLTILEELQAWRAA